MKNSFNLTLQRSNAPTRRLGLLGILFLAFSLSIQAQQTLCQQIGDNFIPDITVGSNENSITTTSSLGVSSWYTQNVVVNGTLVINSNFHIT